MSELPRGEPSEDAEVALENVRAVRLGHGANCSSIGSVIDTLFVGAVVGGAIFAAVCAAMKSEPVRVVGDAPEDPAPQDPEPAPEEPE